MIWCANCNTAVDEDEVRYEEGYTIMDGHKYRNPYEDMAYCPHCGDELMGEEAIRCPICDEWMDPERYICPECEKELSEYVNSMIDSYVLATGEYRNDAIEFYKLWLKQKGVC